jgi:phage terminase small subunit
MAENYINLPLRKLYAELEVEHNRLMQAMKNSGANSISKQVIANIKEIMSVLNKKVHAFSMNAVLNIPGEE